MNKINSLLVVAGLIFFSSIKAQEKAPGPIVSLFKSEEILYLNLEADFKTVFSVIDDSTNFPATMTITDDAGVKRTIDIKIRTRGQTRRNNDFCRFPPLRLSFPKEETIYTPFEGQKALKLVTHCDKAGFYEQNTIIEYLIYKAYNVLTDSSFKVRPAVINYIYEGEKVDTVRKFGFFIEREKHLAERLQLMEIENEKIHPGRLDPFQTCLVDIFQYMIGNTDYSTFEMHNIFLLTDSIRLFQPFPIPYDFDWSGLVSANYAVPNPVLNTDYVSQRVYRGFRNEQEIVDHVIKIFIEKKEDIYMVFSNFDLLNDDEEKKALKYLDEFYEIITNEKKVKTAFFDNARIIPE
jgi:hypothetical protein